MSEVLSEQSIPSLFESSYSSHRPHVRQEHFSLVRNTESRFPERLKTGFGRDIPISTPSMADSQRRGIYDTPSNRINEEHQRRQSLSQRTSREQLPPLSSIFQAPHTTTLPLRTPYPERRSPNFTAISPRTTLRTAAPVGDERHYQDVSYEHRNYTQAAHPSYTFDGRSEGPSIPHSSRTLSSGPITGSGLSQPIEPRYNASDASRAQYTSGHRWSPRGSEPSSSDYFPRTSQNIPSHNKGYPDPRQQPILAPPATRATDSKLTFGEKHFNTSPQLTQYQLNPSGASQIEPSSTKDSLGPKIWTGTHFLPRFVKQQEVPGEGLCYFYDDGSHCKTVIDGEPVNAHWGVTKAGKPRKRLAIACITCREKKIKCDPDYPRCVQCEKFGRICKFKNAPRGANHGSPETTSPTETEDFMDHDSSYGSASQRADAEARRLEKEETESNHFKRRKNTFGAFTAIKTENEATFGSTGNDRFRNLSSASESSIYHESLMNTWYTDPYEANAALTDHLLDSYFTHINSGLYCMFPDQAFRMWLRSSKKKSLDDHMLIYTMLALGTVFSSNEHRERGREFARIARYAVEHRSFSLQLVQSRLILSLYFLAVGDEDASFNLCSGAMCVASALKLNLEGDETEDLKANGFPYDMAPPGYAECRRRTFWSLYIMDRLNGFSSGYIRVINSEDVYLRLPCDPRSFEAQTETTNPYFDISVPSIPSAKANKLGPMAYLVQIASIWGDVTANIYRTSYRPDQLPLISKTAYTNFHNSITKSLESWEASLPSLLQYSTVNLDRSMHEGTFGMFVTMHALYHTIQIKLNRYHRPTDVSPSQLDRNIRKAYTSAQEILALADNLIIIQQRSTKPNETPTTKPEFSTPFLSYAFLNAIDLKTAKGKRSSSTNLLQTFEGAKSVLKQLENFWHSARISSRLIEGRIEELEEMLVGLKEERRGSEDMITEADPGRGYWEMEESIEGGVARGLDCVYEASWGSWIQAIEGCETAEL